MTKIIVANFKMNGTKAFIENYFEKLILSDKNTLVICPPFPYLTLTKEFIKDMSRDNIHLGAQNCHHEKSGAFTGEVSTDMLGDIGCEYVIVGHSERRQQHGEDNALVCQKAKEAIARHLIPIVCVGETLAQRKEGIANDVIVNQLRQSTPDEDVFMIAYEPIWAIGTGLTPTLADIQEMHYIIYQQYPDVNTKILYGGSVTAKNAAEILTIPHVDGVLVGGASLKINEFNEIIGL